MFNCRSKASSSPCPPKKINPSPRPRAAPKPLDAPEVLTQISRFPSMKLSILTDEVSQDLTEVIRFATDLHLEGIELRSLNGKAFKDLTSPKSKKGPGGA